MLKQKIILLSLFAVTAFFFAFFTFSQANELTYQLRGRILLQVEERGRLWYVEPETLQARELTRANYQQRLGELAVGIKNVDLQKISMDYEFLDPTVDSDADSYPDATEVYYGYDPFGPGRWQGDFILAQNMAGRVVLQVEDRGRLWYVNPETLKRYEITDNNFVEFFAKQSLGISNVDFANVLQAEERVTWGNQNQQSAVLFVENFRNCQPMTYQMSLNEDFIVEYEILGKQQDRCRVRSEFLANPNAGWVGKSMTCFYDNGQSSVSEALGAVFIDEAAACEGQLFDLFKGN